MVGRLSVLYYKGVFIASISDAVSSHSVSPGLCTHTETEKKSKRGRGSGWTGVGGEEGGGRVSQEQVKKKEKGEREERAM